MGIGDVEEDMPYLGRSWGGGTGSSIKRGKKDLVVSGFRKVREELVSSRVGPQQGNISC